MEVLGLDLSLVLHAQKGLGELGLEPLMHEGHDTNNDGGEIQPEPHLSHIGGNGRIGHEVSCGDGSKEDSNIPIRAIPLHSYDPLTHKSTIFIMW